MNTATTKSVLDTLSPEDRERAVAEAAEILSKQAETQRTERLQYKELASAEVEGLFVKAKLATGQLRSVKIDIYNSLQVLAESKKGVFETNEKQKTNTFTTIDGSKRIVVGVREISDWDGTETAGIEKVNTYIQSLAKDEASAELVGMITGMLKPDKKGNLDPRRIMELRKIADNTKSDLFKDGVSIIANAYRMVSTKSMLSILERVDGGEWRNIEMDFSDLEIVEATKQEEVA